MTGKYVKTTGSRFVYWINFDPFVDNNQLSGGHREFHFGHDAYARIDECMDGILSELKVTSNFRR
jgi:hypothetical protein